VHGFVRQRAGAADDADLAGLVNVARHDADLALARRDHAGAVRPDQHTVRIVRAQRRLDLDHVDHRNAFGDADDHFHASVGGFQNRVGSERRRHVDHRRFGAGFLHRVVTGVEHRQVQMLAAAAAGGDAADHLGAVGDALFGVEVPCLPVNP